MSSDYDNGWADLANPDINIQHSDEDLSVTDDNFMMIEHNEWKNKTPFFYDFITSHPLPNQSLTVDWSSSLQPYLSLSIGPSAPTLYTLLFNTYFSTNFSFLTIANLPIPTNDDYPLATIPKVLNNIITSIMCFKNKSLLCVIVENGLSVLVG